MEDIDDDEYFNNTNIVFEDDNYSIDRETAPKDNYKYHPWGIFFTIIGTVLLDFDADACQSPSRAYLLDVTLPGQFDDIIFNCILQNSIMRPVIAFSAREADLCQN